MYEMTFNEAFELIKELIVGIHFDKENSGFDKGDLNGLPTIAIRYKSITFVSVEGTKDVLPSMYVFRGLKVYETKADSEEFVRIMSFFSDVIRSAGVVIQ